MSRATKLKKQRRQREKEKKDFVVAKLMGNHSCNGCGFLYLANEPWNSDKASPNGRASTVCCAKGRLPDASVTFDNVTRLGFNRIGEDALPGVATGRCPKYQERQRSHTGSKMVQPIAVIIANTYDDGSIDVTSWDMTRRVFPDQIADIEKHLAKRYNDPTFSWRDARGG